MNFFANLALGFSCRGLFYEIEGYKTVLQFGYKEITKKTKLLVAS